MRIKTKNQRIGGKIERKRRKNMKIGPENRGLLFLAGFRYN